MGLMSLLLCRDDDGRRLYPNPYAVVTIVGGAHEGTVVGTTQSIPDTTDPSWTDTFFVETDPSMFMPLRISIFDDRKGNNSRDGGSNQSDDVLIAETTFEATEIFQSVGRMKSEKLSNGVVVHVALEESVKGDVHGTAFVQLRGLSIKNIEPGFLALGRTDPFYEISKKNADYSAGLVRWYV